MDILCRRKAAATTSGVRPRERAELSNSPPRLSNQENHFNAEPEVLKQNIHAFWLSGKPPSNRDEQMPQNIS